MTPQQQNKLMYWILFGCAALSLSLLLPLWQFSRNYTRSQETVASSSTIPLPTPRAPLPGLSNAYSEMGKPDAVNCGTVRVWTKERGPADACAVAALKAKKPFRLRYTTYTRHNMVEATVLGTREGQVYFIRKDWACCASDIPSITEYFCKNPIIVAVNGQRRIACKGRRNLTP